MPVSRGEEGIPIFTIDRKSLPSLPSKNPESIPTPSPPLPRIQPQLGGTPAAPVVVAVPIFEPDTTISKETDPSPEAFFDTLFDDFSLTAQPVYNFFVPGEEIDESARPTDLPEELPRYIFLRWFLPRDFSISYAIKPRADRVDITRQARVFNVGGISFSYADVFDFSDLRKLWANGYFDVGMAEMKLSHEFTRPAKGTVDEELYILSGMKTPLADIASNDRGVEPTIPYDPYGSSATAAIDEVDPFEGLKLDTPPRPDERIKVKVSTELLLDSLHDDVVDRIVSRGAAEASLVVSGLAGQITLFNAVRDAISDFTVDAPFAPAPVDLPTVEYVGFLIEKQVLMPDGTFQFKEMIEISDPRKSFYIDSKVAYGQVARYRMLCVLRWTHDRSESLLLSFKRQALPEGVLPLLPKSSHVLFSSWSDQVAAVVFDRQPPAPPEQLYVRPFSKKRQIQVAWSFPDDSQRDIIAFFLHRKKMKGGKMIGSWETVAGPLPPKNGSFFDDVQFFDDRTEGYVYAMTSTSLHDERSFLSEQIFCSLNREYKHEGERHVRQVSQPGATLDCHGACAVRPYAVVDEHVIAKRDLIVYQRTGPSKFVNQDSDVTLRLESLDTGETRDIDLELVHVAVEAPAITLPAPGVIPIKD